MTRIGIIGTDTLAQIHIVELLTNNHFEIVGCYAPDDRQSMVFARQYRLISYSSIEALFKYADTVDIAGNLPETMDLAECSLKAIKHVLIVQIDRLNMEQIQYLRKLAEESGVVLQLGTGYRYCPVYETLNQSIKEAKVVDIKHQLVSGKDPYARLNVELSYDFDFVTSILKASICKIDVKTWNKTDILHCRLECDNGCVINLMAYTITAGEPKLEMTFTSSDTIFCADIFKSTIKKQYRANDIVDPIILDAFSEKVIQKHYLRNFYRAICNEYESVRNIDRQFQNMAAADYIVERMKIENEH